MKIGLTLRMLNAETYSELRDAISHEWINLLTSLEYTPVLIPNCLSDPVSYFIQEQCSGLILSNGDDVQLKITEDGKKSGSLRDICEEKLLSHAMSNGMPVLGVCRGLQFINVFFGGTLTHNISGHVRRDHEIIVTEPKIQSLFSTKIFSTNSYHNMGVSINGLSDDLIPWALCGDIVEGLRHKNFNIIAVQWHPERKGPSYEIDKKLS